jgi:hypothetical protein
MRLEWFLGCCMLWLFIWFPGLSLNNANRI